MQKKRYSSFLAGFVFLLTLLAANRLDAACNANFQMVTTNCPTIQFFDASTSTAGQITQWQWNFGDGNTSTLQNPTHTYAANGTYNVCLLIISMFGCGSQFCQTVTINCVTQPPCSAGFQYTQPQCSTVNFFGSGQSTSGTITGYSWDFGDGNTGFGQNPTHTYAANGSYAVCLTIFVTNGCQATFCDTVTVNCVQTQCQAGFTANLNGCPQILFNSTSVTSSGTITSYNWNFGDGGTGTGQNTAHTYLTNGNYIVCLFIVTSTGCQSTYCDTISITCNQPPCGAGFQFTMPQCPTVNFFGNGTTTSGTVTSYNWNFGDGATGTGQNPTHTYTANGSYVACLTIGTSTGCSATFCDTVTISCITSQCQAGFTANLNGCPQILFNSTSVTSSGTITSYNWNFGDGGTGTGQNTAHTYLTNGNYIVCLFIVTSTGCQSTYCDTISITCNQPPCGAGFQFTMPQCPTVNFFGNGTTTSGTVTSYNWTFGDGSTGTGQNPTHTYTANGSYVACLTIGTSTGCSATFCDTVTISCITSQCQASYTANLTGCPQILFNSTSVTSSGTITSYNWNFGDGGTGTGQNTAHTYLTNGNYIVCLFIVTSTGCQSTYCDTISITCNPPLLCQAAFSYQSTPNLFAQFTDLSTATGNVLTWNWSFGDGGSSTLQNPSHVYNQPGNYVVCLTITATDSVGGICTSTTCDTVAIGNVAIDQPNPFQEVTAYPNPFAQSLRIRFTLAQVTDLRLSLHDALGREILHRDLLQMLPGQQEAAFDTEALPSGTYFLRMRSSEGAATLPVLKQ